MRPSEAVRLPSFWAVAAMKTRGVEVFMDGRMQNAECRKKKNDGLEVLLLHLPSPFQLFPRKFHPGTRIELSYSMACTHNDAATRDVVAFEPRTRQPRTVEPGEFAHSIARPDGGPVCWRCAGVDSGKIKTFARPATLLSGNLRAAIPARWQRHL